MSRAASSLESTAVATITLARTRHEARVLRRALTALPVKAAEVFVADGGSGEAFESFLKAQGFNLAKPKRPGLVGQVKSAIRAALKHSSQTHILYTEPDKLPFFETGMKDFLQERSDLSFASRSHQSFHTFPPGQQYTENVMNQAVSTITRLKGDFCYGPLLFSREVAEIALEAPEDLGWGWRFWLLGRMTRLGTSVRICPGDFPCPSEQLNENGRAERIYRFKQLRQNLDGLFRGLEL